jgi:hypothetical protein
VNNRDISGTAAARAPIQPWLGDSLGTAFRNIAGGYPEACACDRQSGRTSAPRWPQAWQTNLGSRSERRRSSGEGVEPGPITAAVVGAIDQDARDGSGAHLGEGDLGRKCQHLVFTTSTTATRWTLGRTQSVARWSRVAWPCRLRAPLSRARHPPWPEPIPRQRHHGGLHRLDDLGKTPGNEKGP